VDAQIGRNLTDAVDGILSGKRYLVHDRDPLFTTEFLDMVADAGVKSVKLPPRSPNLNAHAERFVRTIKESCLERMILFGEESLRTAMHHFVYHTERNHQGLANRLINPEAGHLGNAGVVQRRQRLVGMLNYYYRAAAGVGELRPVPRSDGGPRRYANLSRIESFRNENESRVAFLRLAALVCSPSLNPAIGPEWRKFDFPGPYGIG
jgi:integrase-like protein